LKRECVEEILYGRFCWSSRNPCIPIVAEELKQC
jgi:hypothetical protein